MNVRRFLDRVRDSQFFVPSYFIAASLVLVYITNELDSTGISSRWLISSHEPAARSLLGTVAGAIITVAALVFSLSAVTVQLASNQYSPRVVHGFLRDRFQQIVVGIVMGTFTYALTALAVMGSAGGDERRVDWTATAAVVLGLLAALSIVAFIDHITRRVRIDDTIRRIARRTTTSLEQARRAKIRDDESWSLAPVTDSHAVRADRSGYVQGLDIEDALQVLPGGAVVRFDTWIGEFVSEGNRLFTVWFDASSNAQVPASELCGTVSITEARSIEDDPGFGIRQLVDIALRALSPGINDPATAAEAVSHLGTCLRTALHNGPPDRVHVAANGARLLTPHHPSPSERVDRAYTPIRRAATDQPLVLEALISTITALDDEMRELDRDVPILDELVEATRRDLDEILRKDPQAH